MVRDIVGMAFQVMEWLIIARVLLSWVPHNPGNSIFRFIYEITEPILSPFRRLLPMGGGMPIDLSPILAFFALRLVESLVLRFL